MIRETYVNKILYEVKKNSNISIFDPLVKEEDFIKFKFKKSKVLMKVLKMLI